MIRRQVSYQWRLRETMATRGIFTATELVPLLAERGITLSASQVHRLVSGTPEAGLVADPGSAVRHPRCHPGATDRHPGREHRSTTRRRYQ
jgi:hypothetical protein